MVTKEISYTEFSHMRVFCGECGGDSSFCATCNGTGLVCPHCRGAQWVRIPRKSTAPELVRCPTCFTEMSDGPKYDEDKATAAIMDYLGAWERGEVMDEILTKRAQDEKERKEQEKIHLANKSSRQWRSG